MMRLWIVLLLLANAVALAWNLGALDGMVGQRAGEHEPERLARQINPERVTLLPPQRASAAVAAASAAAAASSAAATNCLAAGPFAGPDAETAERQINALALPAQSWLAERSAQGGSYGVYMGRFADQAALERKQEELKRLHMVADPLRGSPEWQPGLVLARADTAAAAEVELARLNQRGVRTARVVSLRAATPLLVLRLPAADNALRERLAAQTWPGGLAFAPCAAPSVEPAASAVSAVSAAPAASAVPVGP